MIRNEILVVFNCLLFLLVNVSSVPSLFLPVSKGIILKNYGDRTASLLSKIPRGGKSSDDTILTFLDTVEAKGKFFIQGWRWHTMSLVRDAGRLEKLALRIQHHLSPNDNEQKPLEKSANYVVDFNMKGLHRIEQDLFFPWLRKKLTKLSNLDKDIKTAFFTVMDEMDRDRQKIAQMGVAVKDQAKIASTATISDEKRSEATAHVAQLSAALTSRTRGLFEREEKLLVPAVAALVPASEQKSFNSKVIRKLGLLDSRCHLVGMHDAVWELKDKSERDLFQESIPRIPRMMIPRWRRNLYEPRIGVLEEQL